MIHVSMSSREVAWLQVGPQGRAFYPLVPEASPVELEDIVPALAKICRFTGHCREFYSVAQHCVLVSHLVPAAFAREALLHDAAEAFISDIAYPLKLAIRYSEEAFTDDRDNRPWTKLMHKIEAEVARRFDLPWPVSPEVKHADMQALATEQRDLMPRPQRAWSPMPAPHHEVIVPLGPDAAERLWWARWAEVNQP